MSRNAQTSRLLAFSVLESVERSQAYSNLVLPAALRVSSLSSDEKRFATELVYGSLRRQGFYDHIIARVSGRDLSRIDVPVLICLRLGAHQLLTLNKPQHAVVNEMVELAKTQIGKSVTGFINACLRKISGQTTHEWTDELTRHSESSEENLSIEFAHPEWVITEFHDSLIRHGRSDELSLLLEADNDNPLVTCIALPPQKRDDVIESTLTRYSPWGFSLRRGDPSDISGFAEGYIRVQDEGSQLAALALSRVSPIRSGESWLDLCAGPGGKAACLASEASIAGARLTCNEINENRSNLVSSALAPFSNATVVTSDGRDWGIDHPEQFDRIMLDAPCSGLGSLRRRPESRWRKAPTDVIALAFLQHELVDSAVHALKPGGTLAYVTCTPVLSETEDVISNALHRHPDMIQLDAWDVLDKVTSEPLPRNAGNKAVQLWPHVHGTDAMYICLLRKKPRL